MLLRMRDRRNSMRAHAARAVFSAIACVTLIECSSGSGAALCEQSLQTYCSPPESCPRTWTALMATACEPIPLSFEVCGSYNVAIANIDSCDSNVLYFDQATGSLVAIGRVTSCDPETCAAGPTTFSIPSCPTATTTMLCGAQ
jgi:hypothetical protein